MPEDLDGALQQLRPLLLDPDVLVRAVAAGRRRSATPPWRRVELRPIDLKAGRHLQVVAYDERQATTTNAAYGDQAGAEIDALLAQPFGNWHVQTTTETLQLRVTKKGLAQLHRKAEGGEQHTEHDRAAQHLIDPGDPLFRVLGAGASKRRQVDAFLRVLQAAVAEADLPAGRPLRVVDLGCGNAYLSFAAYRFLAADREVLLTGIDQRPEMRERNSALAAELGWSDAMTFVAGDIIDAPAADGAGSMSMRARAARLRHRHRRRAGPGRPVGCAGRARLAVLPPRPAAADAAGSTPPPYGLVTRHNILRERLGDVLTDAVRAALLRRVGYRVEVVQFVSAEYTPRNTMIRAVRTGAALPDSRADAEYEALVTDWGVTPHLQTLLADDLAARR